MLFERFLKKKKQTAVDDAATAMAKQLDALADQARHHHDPAQRIQALGELQDITLVRELRTNDADAGVREAAAERLATLLCRRDLHTDVALEVQLETLALIADTAALERIALDGARPELRRAVIEHTGSPDLLARCALQDSSAVNRGVAIDRLHDKPALERVAREIGKKDKHVYRTAREKLRLIAEQEELPRRMRAQCEEILAKLERLGRLGSWSQDHALLEHLERQWSQVDAHVEPAARARYQTERARFLAAYADHRRENAAQLAEQEAAAALQGERHALLDALTALATLDDQREIEAQRARIAAAWETLAPLPPAQQRALDARYAEASRALDDNRQALDTQRRNLERLRKLNLQLERMLGESKALDLRQAKTLLDQGRALAATQTSGEETDTFADLAERLDSRLATQRRHAEQRLAQVPERLAELETHLAAGELKKADPLYQSLQAGLELIRASGLGKGTETSIASRLRALAPQLRELQHWRRWGADQHREGLCAEMESLVTKELPLEAVAEELHRLQMDWKTLDKSGSPANQALWERFHTASESVYGRCRPFMESQAVDRETNRIARERVCEQIEDFLRKVDWERVDWKRILRAERETRQTWAAIGPTDGRHRKALERRYHQSLRQLDQRLDAERKRNQAHKQDLITRVAALADLPDLDSAIEQTKVLQREWRTTVPARQKDENRLWQSFRAACDAVFERRAALYQAQTNELRDNLAAREAICAEALACAAAEDDPRRLASAQREFEERWRAAQGLPIPRQSAAALAQRWHACRDEFERRRRQAEEGRRRATLELLQRQSAICERLELGLLGETSEPLDPSAARQLWQDCPTLADTELLGALETRFEFALAAAQDPARLAELRRRYVANGAQRAQLCLQLEIIAGLDSPPECAQQRLEYQVARLAERMVEGEEDPLQGAGQLLTDWYIRGPAPRDPALAARFDKIRATLGQQTTD